MADEMPEFEPTKVTNLFDPPPKAPRPDAAPRTTASRGRKTKHEERKQKLLSVLGTVGAGVSMLEQYDGMVILTNAEQVAEATATLADEVPAVAKALDAMSTGGAYGAFLIAIAAMIIPILVHHKLVPEFIGTAFTPKDISQAS